MDIPQILKALSHPVRLQMVELLLQRRMCVRSLARHFDLSEPTISVHLKVLKKPDSSLAKRKVTICTIRSSGKMLQAFHNSLRLCPQLPQRNNSAAKKTVPVTANVTLKRIEFI